jgi:hypothetical protein
VVVILTVVNMSHRLVTYPHPAINHCHPEGRHPRVVIPLSRFQHCQLDYSVVTLLLINVMQRVFIPCQHASIFNYRLECGHPPLNQCHAEGLHPLSTCQHCQLNYGVVILLLINVIIRVVIPCQHASIVR